MYRIIRKNKLLLSGAVFLFLAARLYVIDLDMLLAVEVTADDVTNSANVGAPTETPTPQPTATPPTCGINEHLDAGGTKCVSFGVPGAPTPPPAGFPTAVKTPSPQIKFAIYGYGPANSTIKMVGIGVLEVAQIDETGYFEFVNPPFPTFLAYLSGNYYPELCFQATDPDGVFSMPVCIAPLSKKSFTPQIGPVILPPTIMVSDGITIKEKQLRASGSTLPNAEVNIFVAKKSKSNMFKLVGEVSAFYLPTYKIKSDSRGNFEFSLPTNVSDEWKIFASALFQNSQSPKSNTLTYYIKPSAYRLVEIYEDALAKIKPGLLSIIIGLELLILCILILLFSTEKREFQATGKHKNLKELQAKYKELLRVKATQM